MREIPNRNCRQNQNTHFTKTFYWNSCRLWDNVEKHGTTGEATEDNTAHVFCKLDNQGYKHKLRICTTYCKNGRML